MTENPEKRVVDKSTGQPVTLELFKYDACPFCRLVLEVLSDLDIAVSLRDTRADPAALQELIRIGGKSQVPCLFVNGKALYESADIIRFLTTRVAAAPVHQ